jgi:hypothetical protein
MQNYVRLCVCVFKTELDDLCQLDELFGLMSNITLTTSFNTGKKVHMNTVTDKAKGSIDSKIKQKEEKTNKFRGEYHYGIASDTIASDGDQNEKQENQSLALKRKHKCIILEKSLEESSIPVFQRRADTAGQTSNFFRDRFPVYAKKRHLPKLEKQRKLFEMGLEESSLNEARLNMNDQVRSPLKYYKSYRY